MSKIGFVSIDYVLSKFHREMAEGDVVEVDLVEWTGEALEFLKVPSVQVEAVVFSEVKNFEMDAPEGFQKEIIIAKHRNWTKKSKCSLPQEILHGDDTEEKDDCDDVCDFSDKYLPFREMDWQYIDWARNPFFLQEFQVVKNSKNPFFNSVVCTEEDKIPYETCNEEYSIVGLSHRKIRFSFQEGYVAVAYYKNAIDENGYPYVPDNLSFISAISYYLKWKIAERYVYSGRQGYSGLMQNSERLWLHYARQGKNTAKMLESEGRVFTTGNTKHYNG